MGNLNKVLLIGRITQDIDKRVTSGGNSVVTLSIATNENLTDKQGNKKKTTEYHRVIFWNKQAELIDQYCKKGSQIYVEGSLQTKEWQDKDGNKRWTTEINGWNMQFLDSKGQGGYSQNQAQGGSASQGGQQNQPPPQDPNNFIDDDIPF